MAYEKTVPLEVKIDFTDDGEAPRLQAYAFTNQGKLLGSAPVEDQSATIEVPAELDGRTLEVILGPRVERGQVEPTAASLKRMGAYAKPVRFLAENPSVRLKTPIGIFPAWCLCLVRGRLVKRVAHAGRHHGGAAGLQRAGPHLRGGPHPAGDRHASRCRDLKLRDDLLRKVCVAHPPRPKPDPPPGQASPGRSPRARVSRCGAERGAAAISGGAGSIQLRDAAAEPAHRSVEPDPHPLLRPDLPVAVLQRRLPDHRGSGRRRPIPHGSSTTARTSRTSTSGSSSSRQARGTRCTGRASAAARTGTTHCGTEIVLNLPGAVACEVPTYDIPPGVTLFVLPYAIGSASIWGVPPGAPPAPDGWVRPDGYINYLRVITGMDLQRTVRWHVELHPRRLVLHPFERHQVLPLLVSGARGLPGGRRSERRSARGYRMEYSDRLPTYESYPVGPWTVGTESDLFEFKPQRPSGAPGRRQTYGSANGPAGT